MPTTTAMTMEMTMIKRCRNVDDAGKMEKHGENHEKWFGNDPKQQRKYTNQINKQIIIWISKMSE